MRKGMKLCLVLGIVCLVLGISLSSAALVMGADPFWENHIYNYGWSDPSTWSNQESFEGVTVLKADLAAGDVRYEESDVDKITVRAEDNNRYQWKVDGSTLKIDSYHNNFRFYRNNRGRLIIQVPKGYNWDELHIDLSAGSFYADTISAGAADLEVRAGSLEIDQGVFGTLSAETAAGNIECRASVSGDIKLDCEAGKIDVWLDGAEEDYALDVSCNVGAVRVGDSYVAGLQADRKMNSSSGRKLKIGCNAGAVTVKFEN